MLRANLKGKIKRKEPLIKPSEEQDKNPSEYPHHFGYLANRPKNESVSQQCLICPKILECTCIRAEEYA